jgi:multidrug efflux pump subunit AcrB
MSEPSSSHLGIAGRIAAAFIDSKLTPLVVIASVLLGAAAVVLLPREEEPQIKVPMVDVMVSMPGSTAKEIEERATRPMEKLLWEIPASNTSTAPRRDSESLVIVRFKVGEDPDVSLVRLTEKLRSNLRPHPDGRQRAADQAQEHRRRAHPRAHAFTAIATIISRCADWRRRSTKRSNKCLWWPKRR